MAQKGTRKTEKNAKATPKKTIKVQYTPEEMKKVSVAAALRGLTRTAYVKLRSLNQRPPQYMAQLQRQIYEKATQLNEKIQEIQRLIRQLKLPATDANGQTQADLSEEINFKVAQALEEVKAIQRQAIGLDSTEQTSTRRRARVHRSNRPNHL